MKNKRILLSLLILTVFLMPLMGNTAMGATYTYYFNTYDDNVAWETNPSYMVDGSLDTYASTTIDGDVELCDNNTYSGDPPSLRITKVEIRVNAYSSGTSAIGQKINLTPVFGGTTDGDDYTFIAPFGPPGTWSQWFDITYDPSAPDPWTWSDIDNLDIKVKADFVVSGTDYINCSKVELRVTS